MQRINPRHLQHPTFRFTHRTLHIACNPHVVGSLVLFYCPFALCPRDWDSWEESALRWKSFGFTVPTLRVSLLFTMNRASSSYAQTPLVAFDLFQNIDGVVYTEELMVLASDLD